MPKKQFTAEQIVILLRQIDVLTSQGKTPAAACREAEYHSTAIIVGGRSMAGWRSIRRAG